MDFVSLLFYFLIIIPSSIIHEFAHGWVADRLGDPTARYAGRLTIDPRPHIDFLGTLVMPLTLFVATQGRFMFAYAKPVPFNPYNLRDQRWGPAMVAVAGPIANFLLALCFSLLLRFSPSTSLSEFLGIIVYANIMLAVFNLVPIPPLDGSKVLFAALPPSADRIRVFLERWGYIILFAFIILFFNILSPIINGIFNWLVGGNGLV